jgi:hypothetical protein
VFLGRLGLLRESNGRERKHPGKQGHGDHEELKACEFSQQSILLGAV